MGGQGDDPFAGVFVTLGVDLEHRSVTLQYPSGSLNSVGTSMRSLIMTTLANPSLILSKFGPFLTAWSASTGLNVSLSSLLALRTVSVPPPRSPPPPAPPIPIFEQAGFAGGVGAAAAALVLLAVACMAFPAKLYYPVLYNLYLWLGLEKRDPMSAVGLQGHGYAAAHAPSQSFAGGEQRFDVSNPMNKPPRGGSGLAGRGHSQSVSPPPSSRRPGRRVGPAPGHYYLTDGESDGYGGASEAEDGSGLDGNEW